MRPILALTIAAFAASGAGVAAADSAVPAPPAAAAMAEADIVKLEEGVWDAVAEFPPATADAKPTTMRGVQTNTLLAGNRWIRNDFELDGYAGHGTWGWDPRKGRYVGTWVDSNSDYVRLDEGIYDRASRTLTWTSELRQPDPHPPAKYRMVEEFRGNTRVLTMTAIGPKTGKVVPLGKITFTRRAGPAASSTGAFRQ
jgi:hypothetical protein